MSEFKFACPVCGQHVTCDSTKSGTKLDCPTCFQKLIVPNAPEGDVSKLILNAALARSRPLPTNGTKGEVTIRATPSLGRFPMIAISFVALVCAVIAIFVFRERNSPPVQKVAGSSLTNPSSPPITTTETTAEWTLDLTRVTIPDTLAAGRISGRVFTYPRVMFQEGTLNFRLGTARPPDLGLMIMLPVKEARELAGKAIHIEATLENAPKVRLRWKDDQQQPVSRYFERGYALRLEFGRLSGNHLPGRIYFCADDEAKSCVAGTFIAEILKPAPPKPNLPKKPKRAR